MNINRKRVKFEWIKDKCLANLEVDLKDKKKFKEANLLAQPPKVASVCGKLSLFEAVFFRFSLYFVPLDHLLRALQLLIIQFLF